MSKNWTRRTAGALVLAATIIALCPRVQAQQNDWAVTGGTVVTVTGAVIENGTVLIEDGIITAVGREVTIPAGVERFDARGLFVYPGLIDAGTGVGLSEAGGMDGAVDNFELGSYNPQVEAYIAVHQASEILGVQRVGGFTSVVTGLHGNGAPIPGWDSLINLWGWTPQAMTVEQRIGLRVNWPGGSRRGGPSGAVEALRTWFEQARAYAEREAMFAAGQLACFDYDQKLEGLAPAATGDYPVIFEAATEEAIEGAVAFAEELGLEYIIRGGRDAWKMCDFLIEHCVPLIFQGIQATPARDEPYDVHYATPARLHAAGLEFAISSGSSSDVFTLTYQAGIAVSFGLPKEEALKALTIYPARILGVDDRLGSIERGKIANLVIATGNPVDYTSQIRQLFIRGEKVPWDDKFNRLYRLYRGRPGEITP